MPSALRKRLDGCRIRRSEHGISRLAGAKANDRTPISAEMLRYFKQHLKRACYAARGLRPDIRIPVQTNNPGDQAWYFARSSLKAGDIVYSLGLATNIQFDLNLIRDFGVEIHGFDPTPESVEWIKRQNISSRFHHYPVAISGHDGQLLFELPSKEGRCAKVAEVGSKNMQPANPRVVIPQSPPSHTAESPHCITVPCRRLSSIADELAHSHIALLKMDIEGSEYPVLDDLLRSSLRVDQILVEFHHRFEGHSFEQTLRAARMLRAAGYRLFHVSPWCEEFAFIRR